MLGENLVDSSNPSDAFEDEVDGRASLSVFAPAVSNGDFIGIDPGDSDTLDSRWTRPARATTRRWAG